MYKYIHRALICPFIHHKSIHPFIHHLSVYLLYYAKHLDDGQKVEKECKIASQDAPYLDEECEEEEGGERDR